MNVILFFVAVYLSCSVVLAVIEQVAETVNKKR